METLGSSERGLVEHSWEEEKYGRDIIVVVNHGRR